METMNFNAILSYGLEMTITLLLSFCLYLLRVKLSPTGIKEWLTSNGLGIALSFAAAWLLAVGVVVSPGISGILGALGFSAEQSAAAMALVIAGFTIGTTSEPTA